MIREERGSTAVDFILVGTLLTALTLAVLQLAFGVYVRNVIHDAAVEGAYHAGLADTSLLDGAERTRVMITRAVGAQFAEDIEVGSSSLGGLPTVEVRVRAALPLFGLIGIAGGLEVSGHALHESFE